MISRRSFFSNAVLGVFLIVSIIILGCGKEGEKEGVAEKLPRLPTNVNLIVNPSFEKWEGGIPEGWELKHFDGHGKIMQMFGKSTKEKYSGEASFYLRGLFNTNKWMVLVQRHEVAPGYKLRFSAYIKTVNMKKNKGQKERANIFVRFYDEKGERIEDRYYADAYTRYRLGTTRWAKSRKSITVPKGARYAELGLICQMTGWIYFDDVEMVLEAPIPWIEKKTKRINFYYLDENPLTDEQIKKECDYVENVLKTLKVKPKEKVSYYFYPSEEKFKKILGVKKVHERARWKTRELHTTKPFDDHEIIHLVLYDLGFPPFGLAEGIVFYFKGDWNGEDFHMLAKDYLFQRKIPALYKMLDIDRVRKVGTSIAVPAWCSFSKYLIDRYGIKKFMQLYRETDGITEPGPFNAHFRVIYGDDFDVIDREWRLYVLRYKPKEGSEEKKPVRGKAADTLR